MVNAEKTLMACFTAVRDVSSSDYMDVALRNSITAGEVPGPRMAAAGPPLGITGGHCDDNVLNYSDKSRVGCVADDHGLCVKWCVKVLSTGLISLNFAPKGACFLKVQK